MRVHSDANDPLADLIAALPDGAAVSAALAGPFRRAVRVHPGRGTPTGWGDLERVPWSPAGRFHADAIDPGGMLDHHTGCCYAQDAASQLPVGLLAPVPGELIVDTCAAPGSKSTQIALALGDDGLLLCIDAAPPRRRILAETLARQGAACAVVTPMPLNTLAQRHGAWADGVLADVPCSGHEARSARQVARMAIRQLAILADAARLVRPGGRLVYSTCTPYRAENEDVILAFLAAHVGWGVEPVAVPGGDGDLAGLGAVRLWPQRQGTEPFFACRLRAPADGRTGLGPAGRTPAAHGAWAQALPSSRLVSWRSGNTVLVASAQAAACALPSEARGLIAGHDDGGGLRWTPWGAQAAIERGAMHAVVDHADAVLLWAGAELGIDVADGGFLATRAGAPLGVATRGADGVRLALPSRLRRSGLV